MNLRLPVLDWLRSYDRTWLRGDVVAGITLAAYLLPAGLGDASLANLPPEAGLYACLFGGLVFWLFCSSRYTVITVTSAISLLVGASLGEIAGGDALLNRCNGQTWLLMGTYEAPRGSLVYRWSAIATDPASSKATTSALACPPVGPPSASTPAVAGDKCFVFQGRRFCE